MFWGKHHIDMSTYQAGLLQSKAYRSLSAHMTEALAPYNISMAGWAALGAIYDNAPTRLTEVATSLGVKPPVATNMVRELEKRGMVERLPYPDDNRVTLLKLTEPGKALVERVEHSLRKDLRDFMSDISITELVVYLRVLRKLAAKLDSLDNQL